MDSRERYLPEPIEEVSVRTFEPVGEVSAIGQPKPQVQAKTYSGSHEDWLRAAGIPESDWSGYEELVQRESSWNPNAVNPSSGACSLAQALPCSKMGSNWRDPVVALRWMRSYIDGRYGSVWAAIRHHDRMNWY